MSDHATFLLWASFAVIVAASLIPMMLMNDLRTERRIYWTGWALGCAGIAVAMSGREGWRAAILGGCGFFVVGAIMALRHTPYLRIRRRSDDGDAPSHLLTAEHVRHQSFSRPQIGRRGYDPDEVDAIVERIADRLDGTSGLTADDVRGVTFGKPPPLVRGYDTDEVDAFLDDAAETIARLEGVGEP